MNSGLTDKKARSRERIVDAASKSVRRLGFFGVSVAGVMKEAGLTHGGFYAHFASREALIAEAVGRASTQAAALMVSTVATQARHGTSAFRTFVEAYLADGGITARENGCPVAALCGEMPGQCADVLDASRRIVGNLHRLVQQVLPKGVAEEAAWSIAGTLVGAMQIARVFGPGPQGRAVLAAARAQLVAQYDTPG